MRCSRQLEFLDNSRKTNILAVPRTVNSSLVVLMKFNTGSDGGGRLGFPLVGLTESKGVFGRGHTDPVEEGQV